MKIQCVTKRTCLALFSLLLLCTLQSYPLSAYQLAGYTAVDLEGSSGVFPKLENDGWTGIAFVNTSSSDTNVRLKAYNDAGTLIRSVSLSLGAYEKIVNLAEDLFNDSISGATLITYNSDTDIVGFQLNGSTDGWLLDGIPGLTKFDDSLDFPHIDCNASWQSEIGIINPSNSTASGTLYTYDSAGNFNNQILLTIPAFGRQEINICDSFENGSSIVNAWFWDDSGNASVTGYLKFWINELYRVAIPAVTDGEYNTGDIYVPHIVSDNIWWTGLALVNLGESKTIDIYFDNNTSKSIEIGQYEHKAFTIKSLFGEVVQPDIHSAIITNTENVIGLTLYGSPSTYYLTGVLLKDSTSQNLFYPHIHSDDQWWTGLAAFNAVPNGSSECNIEIQPYTFAGEELPASSHTLYEYSKWMTTAENLALPEDTGWVKYTSNPCYLSGLEFFGIKTGIYGQDDHGDNCEFGTNVALNTTGTPSSAAGILDFTVDGDYDFFTLNVPSSGILEVYTTGTTDTYGVLENSTCDQILAEDDDSGAETNFQIPYEVAVGTYYVRVEPFDSISNGSYTFNATFYPFDCTDADGDGHSSTACGGDDCNDSNNAIYPGNKETCGDGIDQNCDGIDETCTTNCPDNDGDGSTSKSCGGTDCDDSNANIFPGNSETCDSIDNDCDGSVDEGLSSYTYYLDSDGDGYGSSGSAISTCGSKPAGYVTNKKDCDDSDSNRYPGNTETCDNKDNDCDNFVDEDGNCEPGGLG